MEFGVRVVLDGGKQNQTANLEPKEQQKFLLSMSLPCDTFDCFGAHLAASCQWGSETPPLLVREAFINTAKGTGSVTGPRQQVPALAGQALSEAQGCCDCS